MENNINNEQQKYCACCFDEQSSNYDGNESCIEKCIMPHPFSSTLEEITLDEIKKHENTEKFVQDYMQMLSNIEEFLSKNNISIDTINIPGNMIFFCKEDSIKLLNKIFCDGDEDILSQDEIEKIRPILPLNYIYMEYNVSYYEIGKGIGSKNEYSVENMWENGEISTDVANELPYCNKSFYGIIDFNKFVKLLSENGIKFTVNTEDGESYVSDIDSLYRFLMYNPTAWPELSSYYETALKRK